MLLARNVMSRGVYTVRADERLSAACQVMWERDCGVVPVRDGATGALAGIITDRDAAMAVWLRDCGPSMIPVSVPMSPSVAVCHEDDELPRVLEIMRRERVRRLPVLDAKGRLQGLLSLGDVARAAVIDSGTALRLLVAETLAEVATPRDRRHDIEERMTEGRGRARTERRAAEPPAPKA